MQLLIISPLKNTPIIQLGVVLISDIFSWKQIEIEQSYMTIRKVTLSLKLITSSADLLVHSFQLLHYLSRMGGEKFQKPYAVVRRAEQSYTFGSEWQHWYASNLP